MEVSPEDILSNIDSVAWVSDWIEITQDQIDMFADATNDHQFIHVDPLKAATTPFGSTVAHGFLTLALLSSMAETALPNITGRKMAVNYGFEKIRFLSPVRSGKVIRGQFKPAPAKFEKTGEQLRMNLDVSVFIQGEEKPALIAEWIIVSHF